MTLRARIVIVLGAVLFILAALYPPWSVVHARRSAKDYNISQTNVNWKWLWSPPTASNWPRETFHGVDGATLPLFFESATVDWSRLGIEWTIIALGTAVGAFLPLGLNYGALAARFRRTLSRRP
jgi:hypothetical protein